jgi:uncharacterized phage protein gp47/JayE
VFYRRALVTVLAYQSAALASGEYDYLDWIIANVVLPDSCTGAYLDRWLNIVGLQREGAAPAAGTVTFTGNAGTPIAVGTQVQTGNSGVVLETTAAATISGSTATVPVQAVQGGSAGNLLAGTPVNLLVAIGDIVGTAVVAAALTGGVDQESDALARPRLLARLANPPQGGAAADYVAWAQLVPGVTRVWVYPLQTGPNSVTVIFVMDGRSNIIPLSGDIANVQAAINAKRPVTAQPTVIAPAPQAVGVTTSGFTPATGYTLATAQANATAALAALFATTAPGGTTYVEQIETAIGGAAGVASFDLVAPGADVTAAFGVLNQLGAVTLS